MYVPRKKKKVCVFVCVCVEWRGVGIYMNFLKDEIDKDQTLDLPLETVDSVLIMLDYIVAILITYCYISLVVFLIKTVSK